MITAIGTQSKFMKLICLILCETIISSFYGQLPMMMHLTVRENDVSSQWLLYNFS